MQPSLQVHFSYICSSCLVVVLFDSGSMHTFMSKMFVDRIVVPIDDL